ncbi:MAG: TauD/TfdA family dioxygenase [Alphaproteobacteria bacterium]|nr:TauD/TfdA family dioxygenase [Alphaproteobacteria bacterium]
MVFTITPLTQHMGLEFRGLDLTEPVAAETREALNRAFIDYHVVVIRDQQFTPPQFIAAAELFGELQPHDKKELHVPGYPQMYFVSNEQTVPGKRFISGETFHTDHSNHPAPPKATLLFPASLPTTGGDTQYVNMHEAYDDLPEPTKRRIEDLNAVHVYQSRYSPRELRPLSEASARVLPPPGIHPLVRTHPENGRKALYLNPVRIESIVGMGDDEALDLVSELMTHATQKKYEYRHQWQHGDMVIWDNRSVMHKANPDYDMNERRYLYRLMLKGDVPV